MTSSQPSPSKSMTAANSPRWAGTGRARHAQQARPPPRPVRVLAPFGRQGHEADLDLRGLGERPAEVHQAGDELLARQGIVAAALVLAADRAGEAGAQAEFARL